MTRMELDFETGDWLFTDRFGTVWRLKQTGEPEMPLIIIVERKGGTDDAPSP